MNPQGSELINWSTPTTAVAHHTDAEVRVEEERILVPRSDQASIGASQSDKLKHTGLLVGLIRGAVAESSCSTPP
ncbi:MAG: hypothetical protein OEW83_22430, partial [Acidimicrobiia bacterium]|nr:hypothetical protein [Acidimicrobiia bacterium]